VGPPQGCVTTGPSNPIYTINTVGDVSDFAAHIYHGKLGGIDTSLGRGALTVSPFGPGTAEVDRRASEGNRIHGMHGAEDDPLSALFMSRRAHFGSVIVKDGDPIGRDIVDAREGNDGYSAKGIYHTHSTLFGPASISRDLSRGVQRKRSEPYGGTWVYDPDLFTRTGRLMIESHPNIETAKSDHRYSEAVKNVEDKLAGFMRDHEYGPITRGLRGHRSMSRPLVAVLNEGWNEYENALREQILQGTLEYKAILGLWNAVGDAVDHFTVTSPYLNHKDLDSVVRNILNKKENRGVRQEIVAFIEKNSTPTQFKLLMTQATG
jgi:hypothetical protein